MNEAFDAVFDFNKRTVVGDVGNLAEEAGAGRIAAADADPRILTKLLQAERNAGAFAVELENLGLDFLTNLNDFARVVHAAPGEVGDVEQAVDAAEVNERTVVGDVLDDALNNGAFLQRGEQLVALFAHVGFEHSAAGNHHVVTLAIELDNLEFEGLAFVRGRIANRTGIHEGAREERANAVGHNGETALDLARDRTGNQFTGFLSLLKIHPGSEALGLVAGQNRIAIAVFNGLDGHRDEITGLDRDFTLIILELFNRNVSFRLKAGVHDDKVSVHANDFGGNNFARTHFLSSKALVKQVGKRFGVFGFFSVGHEKKSAHPDAKCTGWS